jgi:anti-sigma factor RsiW
MGAVLAMECERARFRVSLGLDGELSEVEQALLRAHVGRCAACAAFGRDVDVLTQELRAGPLERPGGVGMPDRRRSTGVRLLQVGAAAAAVVLAAALGSLAGSLKSRDASTRPTAQHGVRVASLAPVPKARPGSRLQQSIAL